MSTYTDPNGQLIDLYGNLVDHDDEDMSDEQWALREKLREREDDSRHEQNSK